MKTTLKKYLACLISFCFAIMSLPVAVWAEEEIKFPVCYDFEDNVSDWALGKASAGCQSFTAVTEDGNTFARLQAAAGSEFPKGADCSYTPDVKFTLDKPYVLGNNTTTLISSKFRTNYTEFLHKVLAVNYSDEDNNDRYSKHWDTLWMETNGKFREFCAWGKNAPKSTIITDDVSANKWYRLNTYLTTDENGSLYSIKYSVIDADNENVITQTEECVLSDEQPLKSIEQIENIGFEMRIITKAVTVPSDGINIDFDDFVISTYNDKLSARFKNDNNYFYSGDEIAVEFSGPTDTSSVNEKNIKLFMDGNEIEYIGSFDNIKNRYTLISDTKALSAGKYTVIFNTDNIKGKNEKGEAVIPLQTETLEFWYVFGALPQVRNISIEGEYALGSKLTAKAEYYQEDNINGYLEYQWYYKDGNKNVKIEPGNNEELFIEEEINGKYICCGITPVREDGTEGNEIFTDYCIPGFAPEARNVKINGTPAVGEILEGVYDFYDENGDSEGRSKLIWSSSEDINEEFSMISESNIYILTDRDIGKYIKLTVVPVSVKEPYTGEEKSVYIGPVEEAENTDDNIVPNSGFETGDTSSWYVRQFGSDSAKITAVTDNPYKGDYCGFITGRTNNSTFAHWGNTVLKANTSYIASAMVRLADTAPDDTVSFTIHAFPDAQGTITKKSNSVSVKKGEWTRIIGIVTTGNNTATAGFIPVCWPGDVKGYDYYIDDVYFGELKIANISANVPESITIPETGSVSENIRIRSVTNQILTTDGLNNIKTRWELAMAYDGISVGEDKITVTDRAVSGTIYLKAIYQADGTQEFIKYFPIDILTNGNKEPKITDIMLEGITSVGKRLQLNYDFYQVDGGNDDSIIEWLCSDTMDGTYKTIENASQKYLVINKELENKYIKVRITPVSGEYRAKEILSNSVGPDTAPTAQNVTFEGNMFIGSELTGRYVYYDFNNDQELNSKYQWQRGNSVNGSFENIDGADSLKYVLTDEDTDKWIRFSVIPASDGAIGEAVYSIPKKGPTKPTIKNLSIVNSSGRLTSKYDYAHEHGSLENNTEFKWYVNGSLWSTESSCTVSDSGTYSVILEVTPIAADEPSRGDTVRATTIVRNTSNNAGGGGGNFGGGGSYNSTPSKPNPVENTKSDNVSLNLPDMQNHWAKEYAEEVVGKGIINADDKQCFNPEVMVTRADIIRFMFKAFNFEKTTYTNIFDDVTANDDFADMLQTFVDKGIISRDTGFRPNDNISREEFSKVLVEVMENKGELKAVKEAKNFTDSDLIAEWAVGYIDKACRAGLIEGNDDGSFNPKGNITRAQCAVLLVKAMKIY